MSVEALLEERRGYVLRGLADRVAQVDAELAALGFAVDADPASEVDAEPEVEVKPAPVKRRGRPPKAKPQAD